MATGRRTRVWSMIRRIRAPRDIDRIPWEVSGTSPVHPKGMSVILHRRISHREEIYYDFMVYQSPLVQAKGS